MSMNLYFNVVGVDAWVDFPFQTPTILTYKVMDAKTLEERIEILRDYVFNTMKWEQDTKEYVWGRVEKRMRDTKLELSFT